jgi:hypothetical protein
MSALAEALPGVAKARPDGTEWRGFAGTARTRQLRYQVLEPIVIVVLACGWTFLFHSR